MASFSDLVRAQRQSGKGVITSLSGAYNQMNLQRYDPRNALFSKGGIMTSLFPGLKGYQASPVSNKSPSSMVSPQISGSPTALSSIARDARISARNSMALPSIARNMSQMVRIWGGTPAKYFEKAKAKEDAYEAKQGGGKKGFAGLGKSAGGKGFNIMGMLGGALGGIGSVLGSVVGGVGSVIGSILGGIGSLLGGAASGIFGILSSALGGMGMFGVILAAASGFVLYQIFKNADFSALGKGINGTLESIQSSLLGIFNDVDDMSGGKLSKFINDIKAQFKEVTIKVTSAIEVATEALMKLGGAVIKDFGGYFQNFFEENKGKIYALMAIGIMGPRALFSLSGAAITGIAAAVGAMTGEKSTQELNKELFDTETEVLRNKERIRAYREKNPNAKSRSEGGTDYSLTNFEQIDKNLQEKSANLRKQIEEKEGRTTNFSKEVSQFNLENLRNQYDARVAEKMAAATGTSPTPAGGPTAYSYDKKVTWNSLSREQQNNMMYEQARREGSTKPGTVGYRHMNPGNIIAKSSTEVYPEQAKFGGVPGETITHEGVTRTFVRFPSWQAGWDAQRDLWTRKYGNMDLQEAIKKWVNPSKTEIASGAYGNYESSLMKIAGSTGTPVDSPEQKIASAETPKPTKMPGKETPKPSAADTAAAFAADQIMALDKMMGGQLLKGSSDSLDMLRDITREFMNNPTFVDSSQTVNNNMPPGLASAVTGSAYNTDVTVMMSERLIVGK